MKIIIVSLVILLLAIFMAMVGRGNHKGELYFKEIQEAKMTELAE